MTWCSRATRALALSRERAAGDGESGVAGQSTTDQGSDLFSGLVDGSRGLG